MKCACGRATSNLGGVCAACLLGHPPAPKAEPTPDPVPEPPPPTETPTIVFPFRCERCTMPSANQGECKTCISTARNKRCPKCNGPMQESEGYLGVFWGCVRFPDCNGTVSARGTYMRAAQLADDEFNGKPLLPVVRVGDGQYRSKGGRYLIRFVKAKKRKYDRWEVLDLKTNAVVCSGSSCVKLRFSMAGADDTGHPF